MLALAAETVGAGLLLDEGLALDQIELLLEILDLAGQAAVVDAQSLGPVDRGTGIADLPGEHRPRSRPTPRWPGSTRRGGG